MTYHGNGSGIALRRLIQENRVHSDYYRDPEIFDLEMERVFTRAWVYVGHESQVKKPGDYFCTWIGRQPVILSRHTDGQIYVLFNRCAHRGARVLNEEKGNAKQFRCCYHGWSYFPDGELAGVPLAEGYGEDFDLSDPAMGMARVPRVDSYRGFVFASLSAEGPDLTRCLGNARLGIDEVIDRAPEGEVEVVGGVHKYTFRGNWKLQLENAADQYHPPFVHQSTMNPSGRQFRRRPGDSGGERFIYSEHGESLSDEGGLWGFPYGHTATGAVRFAGEPDGEVYARYKASLVARHGIDKAREILTDRRHNTLIYPNLILQLVSQHVRVVRPIAVDLTEVRVYPLRLKGAPEEMHRDAIRYLNITHAPASLIQTDDMETFGRCQQGFAARGAEWLWFARNLGDEVTDEGGDLFSPVASEAPMRNQQKAWLEYMSARGPSAPRE